MFTRHPMENQLKTQSPSASSSKGVIIASTKQGGEHGRVLTMAGDWWLCLTLTQVTSSPNGSQGHDKMTNRPLIARTTTKNSNQTKTKKTHPNPTPKTKNKTISGHEFERAMRGIWWHYREEREGVNDDIIISRNREDMRNSNKSSPLPPKRMKKKWIEA